MLLRLRCPWRRRPPPPLSEYNPANACDVCGFLGIVGVCAVASVALRGPVTSTSASHAARTTDAADGPPHGRSTAGPCSLNRISPKLAPDATKARHMLQVMQPARALFCNKISNGRMNTLDRSRSNLKLPDAPTAKTLCNTLVGQGVVMSDGFSCLVRRRQPLRR